MTFSLKISEEDPSEETVVLGGGREISSKVLLGDGEPHGQALKGASLIRPLAKGVGAGYGALGMCLQDLEASLKDLGFRLTTAPAVLLNLPGMDCSTF